MRCGIALVACAVVLVVPATVAVPAWDGPTRELFVTAHDDGIAFWFEVRGLEGRNPDIRVAPGTQVTIHLTNNGTVAHNFVAAALGGVACCVAPGATTDGSFIAPTADTNVAYFCEPHRDAGMAGRFIVGAGAGRDTPLPTLLVAVALGLALSLRKRFGAPLCRSKR